MNTQEYSYLKQRLKKHSREINELLATVEKQQAELKKQGEEIKILKTKIHIITTADES